MTSATSWVEDGRPTTPGTRLIIRPKSLLASARRAWSSSTCPAMSALRSPARFPAITLFREEWSRPAMIRDRNGSFKRAPALRFRPMGWCRLDVYSGEGRDEGVAAGSMLHGRAVARGPRAGLPDRLPGHRIGAGRPAGGGDAAVVAGTRASDRPLPAGC